MGVYLRRYHQDKPPIGSTVNFGHPFARGLVGCWLMNEGGGKGIYDLANKNNGIFQATTSWKSGIKGIATNYNGTDDWIKVSPSKILSGLSQFSIIGGIQTTASNIAGGRAIYCERAPAGGNDIVKLDSLENNVGFIVYRNDGGTLTRSFGTTVINNGMYHLLCGVRDSAGCKFYTDGKLEDSDARVGNDNLTNAVDSRIGGDPQGVTNDYSGLIFFIYLYNRAIIHSEIRSLYEAPYQFIQTPRRIFYSLSTGAVSVPNPRRSMTGVNRIKGIKAVTF